MLGFLDGWPVGEETSVAGSLKRIASMLHKLFRCYCTGAVYLLLVKRINLQHHVFGISAAAIDSSLRGWMVLGV